jgi:hypothetical protein
MAKQRRIENTGVSMDETKYQHQPQSSNRLKIKLDDLRTFEALTPNQQKFFDMYKQGGYCMALLGSPGVGKCLGPNEILEFYVTDEMYEKLKDFSVD